nr:transposase [Hyella patelloides]
MTICTHKKHCYFGKIVNAQMQLSQVGKIAQKHGQDIPNHFNDVDIDEYIIMPNHVHGIIVINKPDKPRRDVACYVSTDNDDINQTMSKLSPKPGSLGAIIRSYKSSVTRWCRQNDDDIFRWQPRFYENIIRDEIALNNIRKYIINNPAKWIEDQNYVSLE